MTMLVPPDLQLRASWAEAVVEFAAAGEVHMHGSGLWMFENLDTTEQGARTVIDFLLAQGDPDTELPEDRVHCTFFWITEAAGSQQEFLGYLALRHRLNDWLLEEGGHIGYSIRPSRRRQGHATRALELALAESAGLGLDRVLLTAKEDNRPSRAVIEACGGVYEDTRNGMRRYWISTRTESGGERRDGARAAPA